MNNDLLKIQNLHIDIRKDFEDEELLKGLNLEIRNLEVFALVGGSGSGKTTAGLAILRLLAPPVTIRSGAIIFQGENILDFQLLRMQQLRGREISMIFQEPLSAFNPVFTVGFQIEETIKFHLRLGRRQRKERVWELLDMVGIPEPKRVAQSYPHQLSGGMRQRAMIAQAISSQPKLIIADEPTSNLDVTLQANILELFQQLKDDLKVSILLITHDLGVVNHLADRVGILFNGLIVESGNTQDILANPKHPFACELVESALR